MLPAWTPAASFKLFQILYMKTILLISQEAQWIGYGISAVFVVLGLIVFYKAASSSCFECEDEIPGSYDDIHNN
jgi:hypothetical protein